MLFGVEFRLLDVGSVQVVDNWCTGNAVGLVNWILDSEVEFGVGDTRGVGYLCMKCC